MNKIIVYHILLALYWTFTFTFPVRLALYISIKDISSSQYEDFDRKWKFNFSDILVHFHISDNFDSFFQIILQLENFALFFLPFFCPLFCPLFLPSFFALFFCPLYALLRPFLHGSCDIVTALLLPSFRKWQNGGRRRAMTISHEPCKNGRRRA